MKGNALSSSTSGYAYVGGACVKNLRLRKISSVAIVEDRGGYSGVIVAAHELGKAAEHHKNVLYKRIKKAVIFCPSFCRFYFTSTRKYYIILTLYI
jgi:hypothetical protein